MRVTAGRPASAESVTCSYWTPAAGELQLTTSLSTNSTHAWHARPAEKYNFPHTPNQPPRPHPQHNPQHAPPKSITQSDCSAPWRMSFK